MLMISELVDKWVPFDGNSTFMTVRLSRRRLNLLNFQNEQLSHFLVIRRSCTLKRAVKVQRPNFSQCFYRKILVWSMVFQLTYMKKASLSIKYTQKVNTRLYCQRFERKKIIVLECLAKFHTNHGLNNNNRRATPTKPKTKTHFRNS